MKQFAIFCLLLVAALLATDRVVSLLLDATYQQVKTGQTGGKINFYLSLAEPPEYLIMGNSRALFQIIPDSFPKPTFNLSHAGMGLSFQAALVSIITQNKKVPKTILLHLEPSDFTTEQSNYDIQNLKYYYGKNDLVTKYILKMAPTEKIKFSFHSYRHNGRLVPLVKNFIQTRGKTYFGNGYEDIMPSATDSITTLYSYQKNKDLAEAPFARTQFSYLDEFLNLCRVHNIQVITFTSPAFKGLNQHPATVLKLKGYLEKQNVPYYFLNDFATRSFTENQHFWKDSYHLNRLGAQAETSLLLTLLKGTL